MCGVVVVSGCVWPAPVLSGLRRQEDSWVFEEPVTESIAPGYHEQISMPMDYSTVENRLEKKHYSNRPEVRDCCHSYTITPHHSPLQFETDIRLIFTNCIEYNGEDSEYSELANQMLEEFQRLCGVHLDGGDAKVLVGTLSASCYPPSPFLSVSSPPLTGRSYFQAQADSVIPFS